MSRTARIVRNVGIGIAGLVAVVFVSAILIVQSDWFRNVVRRKIIASTEESTGGKVDIGSFQFDWKHLRAAVTGFVIHGNEPPGAAPFVRAPRVQLDLRLFSGLHNVINVAYLGIEDPQANIIVFPDGRTNIPSPKVTSTPNQTGLESVLDLAVGHFELSNGLLVFESQKQVLNIRGNQLRAQLWYSALKQNYAGELSFQPLYVVNGRNTPVTMTVKLPLALQRDRVDFHDGSITTAKTTLVVNGSVENMRNPKVSAHINGHLAIADLRNAANLPVAIDAKNVPTSMDLDGNASVAGNSIQINGLRLGLGQSNLEASGMLKDPSGNGSLAFKGRLSLGELGRLAKVSQRPEGTLIVNGIAKLDAKNDYDVGGNIEAKNVSLTEGTDRFTNINLDSAVHLTPHQMDFSGLRLAAFGGFFSGDVRLQDFERYQVHGNLGNLNLRTAAQSFGEKDFAYDGTLSGPLHAEGALSTSPFARSVSARANLSIAPGRKGIPVSGRLNVDYNGAADSLQVSDSYVALPHTRLNLNGSLGKQLNISLTTSDVNDLLAATSGKRNSSVDLHGYQAAFTGIATGKLDSPRLSGHVSAGKFSVEGREFDSLTADIAASETNESVRNGVLKRGLMQTLFSAQVGLKNWSPSPTQPLSADATVQNGDLADVMAIAGEAGQDYSGALSATVHIRGTVGNPTGAANIQVGNGAILGEPFDRLEAQVNFADRLITVPAAFLQSGASRVDLTANFQHPRDSFTTGELHAHVQSNAVDLAQVRNLQKQQPNTAGVLRINADVTGTISEVRSGDKVQSAFQLTGMTGEASAAALKFEGETYGDISATARTSGQTVTYNLSSNFAGSNIQIAGSTQLTREYPTSADAAIRNLPVDRVLTAAKRKDIPAKGNLSGTAHFSGNVDDPQGSVDVELTKAVLYDEPLDRVKAQATYQAKSVDVKLVEIVAGPARIDASGRFDHLEGNFQAGQIQFRVESKGVDLTKIHNVQTRRPGLGGTFQLNGSGKAELREKEPRIVLQDLTANLEAKGIAAQGKSFGDLTVSANTQAGKVNFALASNLANSSIQGRGSAELRENYPVDAQLTFSNVAWSRLRGLIQTENAEPASFDVLTDGQISLQGPALKAGELRGGIQLSKLQVTSIPATPGIKPVTLQNQGPVSARLDHQMVRVEDAHLTGPQTDIQTKGTISLRDQTMDLSLNANANLRILQDFDRDISSSGSVVVAATVRGAFSDPRVNGRLELHDGTVNYTGLPNGIANANGVVQFNGNTATMRNLTAESGGGRITLDGFATLSGDNPRFSLRANASSVRVRLEQGASIVADANLRLSGTKESSQLSGTATVTRIAYAPQSDIGSFLSRTAPPVQTASVPSPLLDNMRLDIQVKTSDAMAVQTSLAESLQAQADLHVRGTVSRPGVLGRVNITEGKMTFFSSTYNVNSGVIAFYNPVRVEPILDINLETNAKGVDVTLRVTGPVDDMKLSYTSDPPLQFQEIVSLLASGKTPTSDPTILANQPAAPPQSFQQMGESAIVSKALADPIGNRLQRVFGVSQLKIDPTFTSGSQLPQAQMTLQQQIASNLTFTYVTALDNPNALTIRVEATLNPQWSAVATRDQNGIFSVNLLYKRQIR